VTIRPATPADVHKIIDVNLATLPEHYSDSFFAELLRDSPETFIVAVLGGETIGYVMCRIEYGFSSTRRFGLGRKGHIVSLAVLVSCREKGVGTGLVQEALNGMRKRGCSEAFLEVRVGNVSAVHLYERLQFRIVSELPGYYRDGEPAILMSLSLEPKAG